jgi:hypothetical protein
LLERVTVRRRRTPEGKPSGFPYGEDEHKRGRLVLAERSPHAPVI